MVSRRQTSDRARRQRGFTLLEVIVAMVLLAFGITGALAAISACLRTTEAAAEYSRGAQYAQQVVAMLERGTTLDAGTQTGAFNDQSTGPDESTDNTSTDGSVNLPMSDYAWTAEISQPNDSGLYPALITITWRSATRQYQLRTLLRPHQLPAPVSPSAPSTPTPSTPAPPNTGRTS